MRFHAREPDIEPLVLYGKRAVVDAQTVKDRSVQLVHVHGVLDDIVPAAPALRPSRPPVGWVGEPAFQVRTIWKVIVGGWKTP